MAPQKMFDYAGAEYEIAESDF